MCIYVREDEWAALRQVSARAGESASHVIRTMISAYLEAVDA